MAQKNYNTNKTTKKQLTIVERSKIEVYKNELKETNREIAIKLGMTKEGIRKEILKGTYKHVYITRRSKNKEYRYHKELYSAELAQIRHEENRSKCGRKSIFIQSDKFVNFADSKLLDKDNIWSPDAIVGHCKLDEEFNDTYIPCTKTLYNWIDKGLLKTKNIDLYCKVSRKTRNSKHGRKNKKIYGTSIEQRPSYVDDRKEFGHWEIDTVIGQKDANDNVLLTLTERKTRFEYILKIEGKTTEAVTRAIDNMIVSFDLDAMGLEFKDVFKSITSDNGSEFAYLTEQLIKYTNVYFTHPYSSWERGINEKHNGMIRRYIPKGSRMDLISNSKIKRIQEWMNGLPRRILNYSTPHNEFVFELINQKYLNNEKINPLI